MYIKALEQELLRLKEVFVNTTRERDTVAEENRKLKEVLATHDISYDFSQMPIMFKHESSGGYGPSSSGSISGSYAAPSESTGFSPPPATSGQPPQMPQPGMPPNSVPPQQMQSMAQLPSNRLDYDAIGIDFVLTLERPCMDHMQYLLVRSHNAEGQPFHHPMEHPNDAEYEHMSGHALMATAPPHSHIMNKPAEQYEPKMPENLSPHSLSKLLDLSSRLPFDRCSELTPVMAWTKVMRHKRLDELTPQDFEHVKNDLSGKVRCYGFGAVLEDFELDDALENVFSRRDPMRIINNAMVTQQISAH